MHEYMRLCELIHAEPMIAVNTGFGDAYSAADEVEYANGSTSTRMGKLRAAKAGHQTVRRQILVRGQRNVGSLATRVHATQSLRAQAQLGRRENAARSIRRL